MFGRSRIPSEAAQQVYNALQRGEIILVDVREPNEYATERIYGALIFPLSTFDPAALPDNQGKQVVFQCGSGRRSGQAWLEATQAGVATRGHLGSGMAACTAAGLPTVKVDASTSAIRDRT